MTESLKRYDKKENDGRKKMRNNEKELKDCRVFQVSFMKNSSQ